MTSNAKDAISNLILLLFYFIGGAIISFLLILFSLFIYHGFDFTINYYKENGDIIRLFENKGLLTIQLISQVLGLLLPAFLLSKKSSVQYLLTQSPFKLKILFLSVGCFVVSLGMVNALAQLNQMIPLPEWLTAKENSIQNLLIEILQMNSFLDLIICILIIGVVPGICEEWIFRGIIQNQLIRIFANPFLGILLGAIIFSGIHMQFEGFLARFALGTMLGIIYFYGKNLIYSAILHALFNSAQVVMVYFKGTDILINSKTQELPTSTILLTGIISFIFTLWGVYFLNKSRTIE